MSPAGTLPALPPSSTREPGQATTTSPPPAASPRQEVIEAVHRFALATGTPPIARDWDPARARAVGEQWRADRWEQGAYPRAATVRRRFGTWNAAIRAAGYEPRPAPTRIRQHRGTEGVLAALREWQERYGAPPTMADWEPARARRLGQDWRAERYAAGDWPSMRTVRHHFGTLTAAVGAAGLTPAPRGRRTSTARLVQREAWERRAHSPADATAVAAAIRALAAARRSADTYGLRGALIDLGVAALAWAEKLPDPLVDAPPPAGDDGVSAES